MKKDLERQCELLQKDLRSLLDGLKEIDRPMYDNVFIVIVDRFKILDKEEISLKDLEDQCELIQDDLSCVLDGLEDVDDRMYCNVFVVIVDRFKILKDKLKDTE